MVRFFYVVCGFVVITDNKLLSYRERRSKIDLKFRNDHIFLILFQGFYVLIGQRSEH